jgi:hypothetical protein
MNRLENCSISLLFLALTSACKHGPYKPDVLEVIDFDASNYQYTMLYTNSVNDDPIGFHSGCA